jgi:hypothetical protein
VDGLISHIRSGTPGILFQSGEECASPVRLTYFCRNRINVAYSAVFMLIGYGVALIVVYYFNLRQFSAGLIARALICTPPSISSSSTTS